MTDAVSLEPPADGPPPEDLLDETSEDLDPDALVLTGAGAEVACDVSGAKLMADHPVLGMFAGRHPRQLARASCCAIRVR